MSVSKIDVAKWIPLVWRIVREFRRRGENRRELFAAGCLGLTECALRFREDGGASFMTYAWASIMGTLRNHRNKERLWRYCRRLGQSPRNRWRRLVLFSEIGGDFVRGKARTFARLPDHDVQENYNIPGIEDKLRFLTIKEQTVVKLRYGMNKDRTPYTLDEVGRIVRNSRERVRQIEARGMQKLRKQFGIQDTSALSEEAKAAVEAHNEALASKWLG